MNMGIHRVGVGLLLLALTLVLGACAYLQQARFGAAPEGDRLQRIAHSPHYTGGEFQNLVPTPVLREGESTLAIIAHDQLNPATRLRPDRPIPTVKTDLRALDLHDDVVVWMGHSSFYVQMGGKRILIDPVFSPFASPVSFSTQAFEGTNLYSADDMPPIDLLLITHDHWDHLDYDTLTALRGKVSHVLVPLGLGAHLEHWGYAAADIDEADWYEQRRIDDALTVHLVPARHYSGRLLTHNKTLWTGYVLETPAHRMLFSGDSGYGPHFAEIGRRFGAFDLVALDMGQYDPRWPDIHMTPEQAAQAATELGARALLPAHVGRFSISRHAWNEPLDRIEAASTGRDYRLITPTIGERVALPLSARTYTAWWRALR